MQAFPTGSDIRDTTSADITGDGKPDLIVANYASYTGSVSVFLNTSAPGVLTKVSLKVVTLANEGGAFGFAADKVKSYNRGGAGEAGEESRRREREQRRIARRRLRAADGLNVIHGLSCTSLSRHVSAVGVPKICRDLPR